MILLLAIFLLITGAVSILLLPPEKRNLRIIASLLPLAALGILVAPISLSPSFSISWLPVQLFQESPLFRADLTGISFSVYLCGLLIAIEWTRPLRRSPVRIARALVYLLTISGIVAFSAANALSTAVSWAWIDFISFVSVLILNRPVEIDAQGISSSLHNSLSIFALNMLGTILILFPALQTSHSALMDWSLVWRQNPSGLSLFLFFTGITLRLVISPLQFTYSRVKSGSTGTEILLRILPPAAVLALLSKAWPPQLTLGSGNMLSSWAYIFFAVVVLMAGLQWWIASSSFERRDLFCFLVPIFALLTAVCIPTVGRLFLASGAILILGSGMVFLYSGFLPHRRWASGFLLFWAILFAGIPLSPISIWVAQVYSGGISPIIILPLLIVQVLVLSSILRLVFESADEFPSNEPLFLALYFLGMAVCILCAFFPGWAAPVSFANIVLPVVLLAAATGLWYLSRHIHRINAPLSQILENVFRLQWLQNALLAVFGQISNWISTLETFLSGEGVMLWSLGIALLLLLAFRGG